MNKTLIERLKQMRTDHELSQAKLAIILGVAQTTIAAWEVGRSEPDTEMLIRLATLFSITVDYLIGNSNNLYNDAIEKTVATIDNSYNRGTIKNNINQKYKK